MRRKLDKYDTPYAEAIMSPLLDLLRGKVDGLVLEPCAGRGNLVKVMLDRGLEVEARDLLYGFDATHCEKWESFEDDQKPIDWTITNPPFNEAIAILENAWEFSWSGCAFLLPITWNEPCKDRRDWLMSRADNLRYVIPISPRINFRGGELNPKTGKPYGSANCTVCWYVWDKGWSWRSMGINPPFQYITDWR